MNRTQEDIELVRKYFNGELDGMAMQQLEERALEDPFLADAMEGFEDFGFKEEEILLLKNRVNARLQEQGGKVGSGGFTIWAVAASVVVLIGLFSIYIALPPEDKVMDPDEVVAGAHLEKQEQQESKQVLANNQADSTLDVIESSPVVVQTVNPPKEDRQDYGSEDQIVIESFRKKRTSADSVWNNSTPAYLSDMARQPAPLREENASKVARGKVYDASTNQNVSGVVITDPSSGNVAVSNASGEFELPTSAKSSKLLVNSAGYDQKEVSLKQKDSLNIGIKPGGEPLDNVAVVSSDNVNRKVLAGPAEGWSKLRQYLNQNNELETREVGPVTVEFVIQPSGELSNFKILKSLSKLADARAINLIKNYPKWNGASDGTTNKVRITIRFR